MTQATIALAGAGSLGQAFAALIAHHQQPVVLLASRRTADALLSEGRIRIRGAATIEVPVAAAPAPAGTVGVTADPAKLPDGAGLLFCTKGHQLGETMRTVREAWPRAGDEAAWVGGVQNGMAKDDMLAEVFGPARVVGAVTILGAQREANGQIAVAALGMTFLGEMDGSRSERVERAVAALNAAGIPAQAPDDIRRVLWSKACNAAGIFAVTCLARCSTPKMFRSPDLVRAFSGLVRETAAVAAAYGVPVDDYAGFPIRAYVTRSDEGNVDHFSKQAMLQPAQTGGVESFASMTQDLLAGRGIEVDEVYGDLVERAERAGVPAPRLRLARDLLRGVNPAGGG